jgi:hypothetical protein
MRLAAFLIVLLAVLCSCGDAPPVVVDVSGDGGSALYGLRHWNADERDYIVVACRVEERGRVWLLDVTDLARQGYVFEGQPKRARIRTTTDRTGGVRLELPVKHEAGLSHLQIIMHMQVEGAHLVVRNDEVHTDSTLENSASASYLYVTTIVGADEPEFTSHVQTLGEGQVNVQGLFYSALGYVAAEGNLSHLDPRR